MLPTTDVTTKLLKRGKTYYLRYRTPRHIQALGFPREVVKSLKTPDHVHAQAIVLSKIKVMERIYMTTDMAILQSLFKELSDFSCTDELKHHERESAWDFLLDLTDHIRECMKHGCAKLDTEVSSQLTPLTSHKSPLKTQIPEGNGEAYDLLLTLLEAHKANAGNGRSSEFHKLKDRAVKIAKINQGKDFDKGGNISLYQCFDDFLNEARRKNLSEKAQTGYVRTLSTIKAITDDMPIKSVGRVDIKNWLMAYGELPRRNLKAYKDLPVEELLEMDVPESDLISPKSVIEVRKVLQGVFVLAEDNGYVETSPARNLRLPLDSKTYAKFTDEEIGLLNQQALLDPKVGRLSWRRWLVLLAQYTGCRRGELVKLTKSDVILDNESGRYFISINAAQGTVKTKAAIRRIPIHNELVSQGFITFVESITHERLFPELKPSQVTSWFNRLIEKSGISDEDDKGNRKVFHSYRHSVITKIRAAGITDQLMQPVIGHEVTKTITDRYTHLDEEPISSFFPVVDAIEYY